MEMDGMASGVTNVARLSCNLGLLAAICACLAVWSGVILLLTHPSILPADESVLPRPSAQWNGTSQAHRWLLDLLLFWLPIGLGALACVAGVATLAWGQDPSMSRRALIALILSIAPGCLCTIWYLAFSVSPLLRR